MPPAPPGEAGAGLGLALIQPRPGVFIWITPGASAHHGSRRVSILIKAIPGPVGYSPGPGSASAAAAGIACGKDGR